jgi:para-aminobenzoate synthetase
LLAAAETAAPKAGTTTVIAIDGHSGAGKSTLASKLALALNAPVVSLEDLYGGWDGLEAGVTRLVAAVLRPLAAGREAHVPRYDWHAGAWSDPWLLPVPERLVVEGVGAGARAIAPFTSLLVWLELPADQRRERLRRRDGGRYEPQLERWAIQEDEFYDRERPTERADIVLEGGSHRHEDHDGRDRDGRRSGARP